MKDQLDTIQKEFEARLAAVSGLAGLDELKVAYLGKKGALTALLKGMGQLSPEERPAAGQLVNQVRAYIEQSLAGKAEELKAAALRLKLEQEAVDVTMPGKTRKTGSLHPIQQISDEMKDLFIGMGYEIADGPEIEFDYYNFEALNLPEGHPAGTHRTPFTLRIKCCSERRPPRFRSVSWSSRSRRSGSFAPERCTAQTT